MEHNAKKSTDPQENEIDSNLLGDAFRTVYDDDSKKVDNRKENNEPEASKTLDEHQDPASDK